MASSQTTHRAVLAGLSCGIGMAAPVVLYTATLPFSHVNETVAAGAIPFAAGAVAGVGLMCASLAISERGDASEDAAKADFSEDAFDSQSSSEFHTAEFPVQRREAPSRSAHVETPVNPFAAAVAASAASMPPEVADTASGSRSGSVTRSAGPSASVKGASTDAASGAAAVSQAAAAPSPAADFAAHGSASDEARSSAPSSPSITSSFIAGLTGAIKRRRSLDDVPQITRAAGAPSEEEAWAMIDSMLDEDSPVSCDPARSRDVYQVAIDEMRGSSAQTGKVNREDIEAAARAVAGSRTAPAGTTATFVALVANAAAQEATTAAEAVEAVEVQPESVVTVVDDDEIRAAKQAAVDALWGAPAAPMGPGVQSVPYNEALASLPVLGAQDNKAADGSKPGAAADGHMPVSVASAGAERETKTEVASVTDVVVDASAVDAATTVSSAAPESASSGLPTERMSAVASAVAARVDAGVRIDTGDLPDASLEEDVPMADYSGHEDMWAAALSILGEADSASSAAQAHASSVAAAADEPTYVGRHARVLPEDTARLSRRSIERAGAIAEGVLADRRHAHVNKILEEEIDRLDSTAATRRGHEFLSVIEGGTASFKPLKAEA